MTTPSLNLAGIFQSLFSLVPGTAQATQLLAAALQDKGYSVSVITRTISIRPLHPFSDYQYDGFLSEGVVAVALESGGKVWFPSGSGNWTEELQRVHAQEQGLAQTCAQPRDSAAKYIQGTPMLHVPRPDNWLQDDHPVAQLLNTIPPGSGLVDLPSSTPWVAPCTQTPGFTRAHAVLQGAVSAFSSLEGTNAKSMCDGAWKIGQLLQQNGQPVKFLQRTVQAMTSSEHLLARQLVMQYGDEGRMLEFNHLQENPLPGIHAPSGETPTWVYGPLEEMQLEAPRWDYMTSKAWDPFHRALEACVLEFQSARVERKRTAPRI